ncbi:F-box protein [Actinidia chinensis var. chinensis]|uniref:F-box protein n=1 Tax=Actinidia chinensis var. chinensis TaxID=1590841 RepID=A0A2R6RNN7_ACTCC|nr:F-box protein [Actinidia chinensis var. chinensis]
MLPIDGDDGFDRVPDSLVLLIFNQISDIRTLIRCQAVSKRFNSLVPQADTLLLRVDRVVSAGELDDSDSLLVTFFRSILKPLYDLVSHKPLPDPTRYQKSPGQILRGFERIRELEIELPSGDLRLEKGAVIRWRAEFGKTLRSCVILGFRGSGGGAADLSGGGLKMRVVWTISALIAASARHYMLKEVVREHGEIGRLVVRDQEEEGTVVMERDGLMECREEEQTEEVGDGLWWRSNRTTVPAVRMRMRHVPRLQLAGGIQMEGATLVVVRPTTTGTAETEAEEQCGDAALAFGAFGGVYGAAVEKLLKSRSYLLEMNSF